MGAIYKGTHDEKIFEEGWNGMNTAPSYTEIYLKCSLMMDEFVCIGQVDTVKQTRVKSNIDPDQFYRSALKGWKHINS